jgi:hypothetical protein
MANLNVTFNHYGITAVIDETAVDVTALSEFDTLVGSKPATPFRQAVYDDMFQRIPEIDYTDASNTTTFTLGCGTITIPVEILDEAGISIDAAQAQLDTFSADLIAAYPAS